MSCPPYPCALTIAGSDSGGGAGIQADLKTFAANGIYGATVITALTAQNTLGVRAIHETPVDIVTAQLDAVFEDLPVTAVKIGMLSSTTVIQAVAKGLCHYAAPTIVLDPVMIAKSGDPLLADDAVAALIHELLPLTTVLTPNLPEAAWMLNCSPEDDPAMMARALLAYGPKAVLVKGGHGYGEEIFDVLATMDAAQPIYLRHQRIATRHTHGTGCSLSAAIAALLARGESLENAVDHAIGWLHQAIAQAWSLGHGHGPVHHFWQFWPALDTARERQP